MQKHLSLLFKTKYLEHVKGDTSIGSTWCFTYSEVPAPMRRHISTETRPEPSNIGFTNFLLTALPDCGKGIAVDALADFPSLTKKGCETKYDFHPENWGMTKTCGMVYCSLIISKNIMLSHSVCGSVKGYSTNWDLLCKNLAARPMKPILSNRSP
jgi:hypothetical protein